MGIGWGFDPNRQKIGQMPDPGATKNCQIKSNFPHSGPREMHQIEQDSLEIEHFF